MDEPTRLGGGFHCAPSSQSCSRTQREELQFVKTASGKTLCSLLIETSCHSSRVTTWNSHLSFVFSQPESSYYDLNKEDAAAESEDVSAPGVHDTDRLVSLHVDTGQNINQQQVTPHTLRQEKKKMMLVCLLPSAATVCCSPSCSPAAAASELMIPRPSVVSLSAPRSLRCESRHIAHSEPALPQAGTRPALAG